MKAKNNATTTLNGGIDDSTETVVVSSGTVFPSTFPFPVLVDSEIMLCTARTGNTLTCTRGQEDTSPAAHLTAATISLMVTAKFITDISTAINADENKIGAASGIATLNSSTKVVEQPASISDHLEGSPTEDLATKAPTSEWAFDHKAATTSVHGAGANTLLNTGDVDDTPVNGADTVPVSSNWAYDHVAAADPHTGYRLESADHSHASTGAQGGQLDHGSALTGLTDDDHTQYIKHALATAANDFLVASGSGAYVKKTLAEAKTILGISSFKAHCVKTETRAVNGSSGDVAYTGYGFTPTALIIFYTESAYSGNGISFTSPSKVSVGWFDNYADSWGAYVVYCQYSSNYQSSVLKTYDADGFTLTWTKTGSPATGTITFTVIALE